MFNLRIIQANYGDCFILEFGDDDSPRHLLVDGGPKDIYEEHLRDELEKISNAGGKLELAMISHVDRDHIVGVLDLAAELEAQKQNDEPPLVKVDAFWINSFEKTIDPGNSIETRFKNALAAAGNASSFMSHSENALLGIGDGNKLRIRAAQLQIPINPGFPNELVCVDDHPEPIEIGNLKVSIVGPTRENLEELQQEWEEWLDENEPAIASNDPNLLANSDQSIPNLSSIMVLAEADGKSILFTGDGRSDHLLDGLETAGKLDDDGKLHVDVLKVPHHGSDRNATKTFFKKVTADTYVISANYHPDNPDLSTLIWIVEAAKQQDRDIRIMATNPVNTLFKLKNEYPEQEYSYDLDIMPGNYHYWLLELS